MSTASIRLYDIFRKNLKLQEVEAKELVEVIQDIAKTESADKHKHIEQMVQKDMTIFDQQMNKEFGYMKTYIDNRFATKEDIAKDLAALRAELSRTIYLTSLGQLVAIIASVISLVLILKK
jgi:predicted GNAT family acetyltransferase